MAMGNENGGLFDLSQLGTMLSEITGGAEEARQAEQQRLDVISTEANNMVGLAASQQELATKAAERIDYISRHAQREVALGQGDFVDQLTLLGAQLLDPTNYTAAGRNAQMGIVQDTMQAGSMVTGAYAALSEARVAKANADSEAKQYAALAAGQRLKTRVEAIGLLTEGIGASENLRLASLGKLSTTEITSALGTNPMTADNMVSVGQFKYSRTELLERKKSLETREHLAKLSPLATDPDYAAKIDAHHRLQLQYMTYEELQQLKEVGGELNGTIVDRGTLDTYLANARADVQNRIVEGIAVGTATQQFPKMLAESAKLVDSIDKMAKPTPGSPLHSATTNFRATLGTIDSVAAANDKSGFAQRTALEELGKAQVALDSAIEEEAKQRALGDPILTNIIKDQLYGRPVDPASVSDFVVQRFVEGKPYAQAIPPADVGALNAEISKQYSMLERQNQGSFDSADERKEARKAAAAAGLEVYRARKGQAVHSDTVNSMQFRRPDNPLVILGMSAASYKDVAGAASRQAQVALLQQHEIQADSAETAAIFNAIGSGDTAVLSEFGIDAAVAEQIRANYVQTAVMYEYDMMENIKPGLGMDYARWLMSEGEPLAKQTAEVNIAGNDVTPNLFGSMFAEQAVGNMKDYTYVWSQAANTAGQRTSFAIQTTFKHARNPSRMFPAVLNQIDSLTPDQRKAVMTGIITPAINEAKAKQLSDDETAKFVAQALEQGVEGDPALSKAAAIAFRHMPAAAGRYESILRDITTPEGMEAAIIDGTFQGLSAGVELNAQPSAIQQTRTQWLGMGQEQGGSFYGRNRMDSRALVEDPGAMEAALEAIRQRGF